MLQGEGSRNEMLAHFRSHGNAVLLGSLSFWEGVDVRGEVVAVAFFGETSAAPA